MDIAWVKHFQMTSWIQDEHLYVVTMTLIDTIDDIFHSFFVCVFFILFYEKDYAFDLYVSLAIFLNIKIIVKTGSGLVIKGCSELSWFTTNLKNCHGNLQ